ncbi:MAG: glycosyltransferase family 4 protein [Nitrospiraceae bacterium]|nr:glycosyltransferase family 4 protein [Nitrospiraceae bacterium]
MKILQIIYESDGSPFGVGGAGVRAYEIYTRLRARHEVTFLCMRYPGARDGEHRGVMHTFAGTDRGGLTRSVIAYTMEAARFVRRRGGDFDVIVENFLPSTPFFSGLLSKTPVVLQVQGVMYGHVFRKFNPFYSLPLYAVEKWYPSLYDRFIFVSGVTKEKVMRGMRRSARFCRVIPNGINRELLTHEAQQGDYILFFSRLDSYTKGLDILLDAFAGLAAEFPDVRLVMAGHETDSFKGLVAKLPPGVKGRVAHAGFLTGPDKTALLAGARAVVLPSRHESSPVSIVEAAACGKPLIVSDIPEMAFVKENGFGLSFPSGSASGLKETMRRLLADSALRTELGRRGRGYAGRFLWDDIAVEFGNALELIADEKR